MVSGVSSSMGEFVLLIREDGSELSDSQVKRVGTDSLKLER